MFDAVGAVCLAEVDKLIEGVQRIVNAYSAYIADGGMQDKNSLEALEFYRGKLREMRLIRESMLARVQCVPVSLERVEELRDCWNHETNDSESARWRQDITQQEAEMVEKWDSRFFG